MSIGFNTRPTINLRKAGLSENNFLRQDALLSGLRIDGGIELNGLGRLALDLNHDTRISSLADNTMLFETGDATRLTITNTAATFDASVALTFAGAVSITNATASTTPTTGALIVTGGVGIGGNLHVAGSIIGLSGAAGAGTTTAVTIQANEILFEGTTADAFETILRTSDVTADRIYLLPNYPDFTVSGYTAAGLTVTSPGESGVVLATSSTLRSANITTGGAGNIAGTDLTLGAGLGTGTGDEGTVIFSLPVQAGAGDIIQTTGTRLTLDMAGSATVLSMTSAQALNITTPAATAITLAPGTTGGINTTTQTLTQYYAVNDGNPVFNLGSAALEQSSIQSVYNAGLQTLARLEIATATAGVGANAGLIRFVVDGATSLDINDAGLVNTLAVAGGINTATSVAGTYAADIINNTDAASVSVARFQGDRATPADNDAAFVSLFLSDSAGTQREGGRITWQGTTILAGATGDTDVVLSAMVNNAITEFLRLDASVPELVSGVATRLNTATNQVTLGVSGANGITLTAPAPAASRTYTVGDAGANASFVMTEGAQTLNGVKTFGDQIAIDELTNQIVTGNGANLTTLTFPASAGAVTLTFPNTADTMVGRATTDVLTNKTLTAPDINAGTISALTELAIRSTGAAFDLTVATATAFTAGRTLTIDPGDAARTVTITGNPTLTVGTMAVTGNPLSQFAATTSLQLLGVISDETGSGALVFANTPTLVTPLLGTPTSGVLTNCTGLPIVAGTTGTLTVARGGTNLTTTTANQLLYSSALDTIAGLATAASGVLITSATGVPSISATLPQNGSTIQAISLDAATAIAVTSNVVGLTTVGAETLTTITGGVVGQILTIIFRDGNCTLTDTAAGGAADTIALSAALTGANGTTLTLVRDTTQWFEIGRAVNG